MPSYPASYDIEDAKTLGRRLKAFLDRNSKQRFSHVNSLEAVASLFDFPDFRSLSAAIEAREANTTSVPAPDSAYPHSNISDFFGPRRSTMVTVQLHDAYGNLAETQVLPLDDAAAFAGSFLTVHAGDEERPDAGSIVFAPVDIDLPGASVARDLLPAPPRAMILQKLPGQEKKTLVDEARTILMSIEQVRIFDKEVDRGDTFGPYLAHWMEIGLPLQSLVGFYVEMTKEVLDLNHMEGYFDETHKARIMVLARVYRNLRAAIEYTPSPQWIDVVAARLVDLLFTEELSYDSAWGGKDKEKASEENWGLLPDEDGLPLLKALPKTDSVWADDADVWSWVASRALRGCPWARKAMIVLQIYNEAEYKDILAFVEN